MTKQNTPNQKNIVLTSRNVAAMKKKYPTTFKKLDEMIGNPAATSLAEQLPYYNQWLGMHGYDNEAWFKGCNRAMKSRRYHEDINTIECITDVEARMYELVCDIPDCISDNEIFDALETAIGRKRGE